MLFKTGAYLRFLKASHNQYGVHSPFVYDFITKCLYNHEKNVNQQALRNDLKQFCFSENNALSPKKLKLLLQIINYFNPEWLANRQANNELVIENLKSSSKREIINLNSSKNIEEPENNVYFTRQNEWSLFSSEVFQSIIHTDKKEPFCLFFINKKHLNNGLKAFLESAFDSFSPKSLLILEGVHNSKENETLWTEIKNLNQVSVTVDLFFWGIVFLRKGQAKEHFKIRV